MRTIDELRVELCCLDEEIAILKNTDYAPAWQFCFETRYPEISKADFRELVGKNTQRLMEKTDRQMEILRELIALGAKGIFHPIDGPKTDWPSTLMRKAPRVTFDSRDGK